MFRLKHYIEMKLVGYFEFFVHSLLCFPIWSVSVTCNVHIFPWYLDICLFLNLPIFICDWCIWDFISFVVKGEITLTLFYKRCGCKNTNIYRPNNRAQNETYNHKKYIWLIHRTPNTRFHIHLRCKNEQIKIFGRFSTKVCVRVNFCSILGHFVWTITYDTISYLKQKSHAILQEAL